MKIKYKTFVIIFFVLFVFLGYQVYSFMIETINLTNLIITSSFVTILMITFYIYMMFDIIKPIERINETLQKISQGDLTAVFSEKNRDDEIGQMIVAMERMMTSLKLVMRKDIKNRPITTVQRSPAKTQLFESKKEESIQPQETNKETSNTNERNKEIIRRALDKVNNEKS